MGLSAGSASAVGLFDFSLAGRILIVQAPHRGCDKVMTSLIACLDGTLMFTREEEVRGDEFIESIGW